MKYLLKLDYNAADELLVAMLKDSIAMHEKGYKKYNLKPDKHEKKYLEAAKIVVDWFSVQK